MIPVYEPVITQKDVKAVISALMKGEISGTHGEALKDFEQGFASYCGCKHGIATSSGTTALHLAVASAGIGKGDEVLISASTNIATALAVVHNGAIPVPVDSEDVTWNLDLGLLESLITPRTRAIIPVHLFGHPVDMNRLLEITKKYGLIVIEDAAEAHGATCSGKRVGSFGDMGCFSFYANKVITTGEGGMVVTNSDTLAYRLRSLKNLAFTTPRFKHLELGYNFRMTNYQAALGLSQLNRIDYVIKQKRRVAETYTRYLHDIPGLQLPVESRWGFNVYWMYGIVVKPEFGATRDELIERLKAEGVDTRTFFCPMNQQPALKLTEGFRDVPCPVADRLWEMGLYLPSSYELSEGTIKRVTDTIRIMNLERGK
jgi:perosamine synthetase